MKASVIIPTYNGVLRLERCLTSLNQQNFKDFEVVIAIDGSTDNTKQIISDKQYHFPIQLIESKNIGRAAIRNLGAKNARFDLLYFLDDDMVVDKNWVGKHRQFHIEHSDCMLVGRCKHHPELMKQSVFDQYRGHLDSRFLNNSPQGEVEFQVSYDRFAFTTQNLSMPKTIFGNLSGFDESLRDSEDFDFCMRALGRNQKIFFRSDILAYHYDSKSPQEFFRRQSEYWSYKKLLGQKFPEYLEIYPKAFNQAKISGLKSVIYPFFVYNKFWKFISEFPLIPLSWRFKLMEKLVFCSTLKEWNANSNQLKANEN